MPITKKQVDAWVKAVEEDCKDLGIKNYTILRKGGKIPKRDTEVHNSLVIDEIGGDYDEWIKRLSK